MPHALIDLLVVAALVIMLVVAFLMAVLLVAEVCAAEGVFTWVGGILSRVGRHRPVPMLGLTFVAAAITTAVLSLDATVVLLTPVVVATATGAIASPRPMVTRVSGSPTRPRCCCRCRT